MKRSLSLLLASLMLVFALTACGRRNDTPQDNGQNGNQSESAVVGGESAVGSNGTTAGNGGSTTGTNGTTNTPHDNSLLEDAGNAVEDGLNGPENAVDDVTGNTAEARNSNGGNNRH